MQYMELDSLLAFVWFWMGDGAALGRFEADGGEEGGRFRIMDKIWTTAIPVGLECIIAWDCGLGRA